MGHPAGLRAGTRYAFSRAFREKGMIRLSTYLKEYKYVKVENWDSRLSDSGLFANIELQGW